MKDLIKALENKSMDDVYNCTTATKEDYKKAVIELVWLISESQDIQLKTNYKVMIQELKEDLEEDQ